MPRGKNWGASATAGASTPRTGPANRLRSPVAGIAAPVGYIGCGEVRMAVYGLC